MLHFSRWKIIAILVVALGAFVFSAPNLVSREDTAGWPEWLQSRLTLGLDLQGGSHVLLQVETDALIEDRLDVLKDDVRSVLRDARIGYTGLAVVDGGVQVRVRDEAEMDDAEEVLGAIPQPVTSGAFGTSGLDVAVSRLEGGLFRLTLSEAAVTQRMSSAVEQSIEVIRRRVDQIGTTEPSIQREGDNRILVQVPGLDDPQRLKDILQQTAALSFHLVCRQMTAQQALETRPPAGCEVLQYADGGGPILVETRAMITGDELVDSQPSFNQQTGEPVVTFRFNTSGARRFGEVTEANVGEPFAIVLDDEVISAPEIREPIRGGSGQISGSFTSQSANDLAVLLRAGALPTDITIVEERSVGPSLGADSVAAGEIAGIIGAIGVVTFMVLAYGLFGIFANIALAVNIALIIATLSLLGATLTLPGIAGIVLTVGMAVDSNVLIFERIRDEARRGRAAIPAIDAGFREALRTILDANITTLIAAVILFFLGSGPVQGFAVTLAIGIVTTVFTAFTMTRLLVALWVRRVRPSAVPI
ncbi:MAG: protein translocase subunit SecD [Hyphomicrobiaceae bacterium]|nr:protein translocase subunit SecD [Hyphomicrobiaceae bacterium]